MSREPLTEDELARLESVGVELKRLFANRPDEGPFAADWDEWLLQLGEFTATNRTAILDALRDTPVAEAVTEADREWALQQVAALPTERTDRVTREMVREAIRRVGHGVADTAGIDAAWGEAEAALPEGTLLLSRWEPGVYRAVWSGEGGSPRGSVDADRPAAALLALAAALRTPKPEGEPEHWDLALGSRADQEAGR